MRYYLFPYHQWFMRYQAKRKTSFWGQTISVTYVRTKLLLLRNKPCFYVLTISKIRYISGNNRAIFLPFHSFIIYSILIRKIHSRSHGNFLICFAVFPAPCNSILLGLYHGLLLLEKNWHKITITVPEKQQNRLKNCHDF